VGNAGVGSNTGRADDLHCNFSPQEGEGRGGVCDARCVVGLGGIRGDLKALLHCFFSLDEGEEAAVSRQVGGCR
jgi:hypothetical protein